MSSTTNNPLATMLPYDATGTRLLREWNEAIKKVAGWAQTQQALLPTATTVLREKVAAELEQARAEMRAAKVAHDRHRYQQANPTHPVCADQLQANDAQHQHRPTLYVVAAIHEGSNALAA